MHCAQLLGPVVDGQNERPVEELLGNLGGDLSRKLMLSNSHIGSRGLLVLVRGGWAEGLKELLLWDNKIGDNGLAILAMRNWTALESLRLAENNITKTGARHLIKGSFPHLSSLSLYKNPLGNEGAKILSKGVWPRLSELLLHNCEIGSQGISELTNGSWPALCKINLGFNKIGEIGALSLFTLHLNYNPCLSQLQSITITKNNNRNCQQNCPQISTKPKQILLFSNGIRAAFVKKLKFNMQDNLKIVL